MFILKKDSIHYLVVSTFDRSCFKIDLNGRVSNQRTSFKKADIFLTEVSFAKRHPMDKKMSNVSETDYFFKEVFFETVVLSCVSSPFRWTFV